MEAKTATPLQFPDFGKWLTFAESIKSVTAIRRGIANVPTLTEYQNMTEVYNRFYAPICERFGKLPVSSFFRSQKLNTAIGGAKNSAHLYGCAIDIDCDGLPNVTNRQLFDWIRANLRFDQVILESPDQHGNPAWVHVAINRNGQKDRSQVLRMTKVNGKSTYQNIA